MQAKDVVVRSSFEGLSFRAVPGSTIRIEVNAKPKLEVPDGDLTITPHWATATKDRLVGIAIEEEITPYFEFLAVCGIVAVLFAAALVFRRRRVMGTARGGAVRPETGREA